MLALEGARGAGEHAVMALATTRYGAARVSAFAGTAVGRVTDEAVGIWHDARTVARGPAVDADQPAKPSSDQVYLAWYAGLATMALLRIIEWRLAAVIAAVHTVERYGHRRRLEEFLEGVEAGGI
jgi:hypothetical protein